MKTGKQIGLRLLCLLIGYLFGCILTADIVARKHTGKSAAHVGESGNPGMANIMEALGFKAGIIVLAGDLLKTTAACLLSLGLAGSAIGRIAALYAGFGAAIGHNFPFWRKWKGGKGVTVTCMALPLFSIPWGIFSDLVGALVVILTGYLSIGGVVIPAVFSLIAFPLFGVEAGILGLLYTVMMVQRHYSKLKEIPTGQCKKYDIIGLIRGKLKKTL